MNRINQAYLNFPNEKELLHELIQAQFTFTELKEKGLPSIQQEKNCLELKLKILDKLGEEKAEQVQLILTNCENLVRNELELQTKLNTRMEIDYEKQQIKRVTYINVNQGHALVNCQLGDNTNLSYQAITNNTQGGAVNHGTINNNEGTVSFGANQQITELTDQQAHILQLPPKP
jgi:hypothetical protein